MKELEQLADLMADGPHAYEIGLLLGLARPTLAEAQKLVDVADFIGEPDAMVA